MSIEADAVGFAVGPHCAQGSWLHGAGRLALDQARVMGVVNLTPDSFFDGGVLVAEGTDTANVSVAVRRCHQLVADGAHIIDIGGESTRPGSDPVSDARQLRRVVPVIERLTAGPGAISVPVSVDTRSAAVAEQAVRAGAAIVNDVSGLADPAMIDVLAAGTAGVVIGHLRGQPSTMQRSIRFADLLGEVTAELRAAVTRATAAGIARERIVVDPGIGFGKSSEHSAALVAASCWLREATGCAVMIGASRKSFLAAITAGSVGAADNGLLGSVVSAVIAVQRGAAVIRVHDVAQTTQALAVARAIALAWSEHAARAAQGQPPPKEARS